MDTERKIIAIDFGSTQSSITYMTIGASHTDKPEFIKVDGYESIPTVMAIDKSDGSLRAWGPKVTSFIKDNDNDDYICVDNFKRDLGESKEANIYCKEFIQRLADAIKRTLTNGDKLDYEYYDTIISVPVNWDDNQISLIKKMMFEAGLPCEPQNAPNSIHILREPFAAMHSVLTQEKSFQWENKAAYYLVVDFGGGTLDVCVVRTEANGKDPRDIAIEGNSKLGGKDFDDILLKNWICKDNPQLNPENLQEPYRTELYAQVKSAKERISQDLMKHSEAGYKRTESINLYGKTYKFDVTRHTIRNIYNQEIMTKFQDVLDKVIKKANIQKSDISKVFLSGGSSQWFIVEESVRNFFDKEYSNDFCFLTEDSHLDVAKGLSYYVAVEYKPEGRPGEYVTMKLNDTLNDKNKKLETFEPGRFLPAREWKTKVLGYLPTQYFEAQYVSVKKEIYDQNENFAPSTAILRVFLRSNVPGFRWIYKIRNKWRKIRNLELIPLPGENDKYLVSLHYRENSKFSEYVIEIKNNRNQTVVLRNLEFGKMQYRINAGTGAWCSVDIN